VIPLWTAQARVLGAVPRLPVEKTPLAMCLGLALAADVTAPHPVPPFPNSAMDGYAVRSDDLATTPVRLSVLEDVPAGKVAGQTVTAGTAIRIMTGAPIPAGADTVVRVEDTKRANGEVEVMVAPPFGASVRPAGGDVAAGTVVFEAGTRLTPAHIGVLATLGVAMPLVGRRPRVAFMSTGDELMPYETSELAPGRIRDSNRPLLAGLLDEVGVECFDLGIVPDDAALLTAAIGQAASEGDVVVTSGGVSMGDYDLVKQVLGELGDVEFWQVAMQPAKPFAFGFVGGVPLFGLPGNPVSAMVAFEQFVRPALLHMMGCRRIFRPRVEGVLDEPLGSDPAKTVFARVRTHFIDGIRHANSSGGQASNVLSAVAFGDGFAVIPVGAGDLAAGSRVELEMFRWPEDRTIEEAHRDE